MVTCGGRLAKATRIESSEAISLASSIISYTVGPTTIPSCLVGIILIYVADAVNIPKLRPIIDSRWGHILNDCSARGDRRSRTVLFGR